LDIAVVRYNTGAVPSWSRLLISFYNTTAAKVALAPCYGARQRGGALQAKKLFNSTAPSIVLLFKAALLISFPAAAVFVFFLIDFADLPYTTEKQ
jgi:hypothetical protein